MEQKQLEEFLENYELGTPIKLNWQKQIKLKDGNMVAKNTIMEVKLGINYADIAPKKEIDESAPQKEYKPTNWIIQNILEESSTGKKLLHIYPTYATPTETKWLKGEEEVQVETLMESLYAADKPKTLKEGQQPSIIMKIDLANLIPIN